MKMSVFFTIALIFLGCYPLKKEIGDSTGHVIDGGEKGDILLPDEVQSIHCTPTDTGKICFIGEIEKDCSGPICYGKSQCGDEINIDFSKLDEKEDRWECYIKDQRVFCELTEDWEFKSPCETEVSKRLLPRDITGECTIIGTYIECITKHELGPTWSCQLMTKDEERVYSCIKCDWNFPECAHYCGGWSGDPNCYVHEWQFCWKCEIDNFGYMICERIDVTCY
jgi:hypothetical protein